MQTNMKLIQEFLKDEDIHNELERIESSKWFNETIETVLKDAKDILEKENIDDNAINNKTLIYNIETNIINLALLKISNTPSKHRNIPLKNSIITVLKNKHFQKKAVISILVAFEISLKI